MTSVTPGGASASLDSVAGVLANLRQIAREILAPRPPELGERAAGHGISGAVLAVSGWQPLATDNIWRITLAGEAFGRLVGRARDGAWQLLSLDELTDAQLDAYGDTVGPVQHQRVAQPTPSL